MNKKVLIMAMMLAVLPLTATGASVYKWTDENGVTHFGDREPSGKTSEQVSIRTGKSSGGQPAKSAQEQLKELESRDADAAERRDMSAADEARAKQRNANCETARNNLNLLASNNRIRIEEDGEQRYLSQEEIQEQREKFQSIADDNCGPSVADQSER